MHGATVAMPGRGQALPDVAQLVPLNRAARDT
jgi:hypothetical protein